MIARSIQWKEVEHKGRRGFTLHLNPLQIKENKNASHGLWQTVWAHPHWFPAACVSGSSSWTSVPKCMDAMRLNPNGTIKMRTPSKQPQVRFVHEVQMKHSWSCCRMELSCSGLACRACCRRDWDPFWELEVGVLIAYLSRLLSLTL